GWRSAITGRSQKEVLDFEVMAVSEAEAHLHPVVLVTGAAGFIGYHVARRLLERGDHVLGLDNLNDYYDVRLKEARLTQLASFERFQFHRMDLVDRAGMSALFADRSIRRVVIWRPRPGCATP